MDKKIIVSLVVLMTVVSLSGIAGAHTEDNKCGIHGHSLRLVKDLGKDDHKSKGEDKGKSDEDHKGRDHKKDDDEKGGDCKKYSGIGGEVPFLPSGDRPGGCPQVPPTAG